MTVSLTQYKDAEVTKYTLLSCNTEGHKQFLLVELVGPCFEATSPLKQAAPGALRGGAPGL